MKPRIKVAESRISDGGVLTLYEHDGAYSINLNSQELMVTRATASERLMGKLGAAKLKRGVPTRLLIGGLGLGFTLRSVLETVGAKATVEVAELIPAVVKWNRTHLKDLNGSFLEDSRVKVRQEDVVRLIRNAEPETYDVILLDVDNGPVAMVAKSNSFLYTTLGIRAARECLKSDGRVVYWSAGPDKRFEERLAKEDFKVELVPAKLHENAKRFAYSLYVADKRPTSAGRA